MAYELRDNSGSVFKNDKKENDKHPDYKGTVMVNGKEMWISMWVKTAQSGKNQGSKFFSVAFKDKEMKNFSANDFPGGSNFPPTPPPVPEPIDDLPF